MARVITGETLPERLIFEEAARLVTTDLMHDYKVSAAPATSGGS